MPPRTATTSSPRKAFITPPGADPLGFQVGGVNTRRVEPRNTPSVINAVFNHRQFWDGRAENVFNGVNHLGERDPDARVFRADDPAQPIEVRVEPAGLQPRVPGRGPDRQRYRDGGARPHAGGSGTRACRGHSARRARRSRRFGPLAKQQVAATDSELGTMTRWPQKGPRLQSLRPDDQGRFPRAVVAVQQGHSRECGRFEDAGGEEQGRVRDQQLQRERIFVDAVQLRAVLRHRSPDVRGHARLRRYAVGPLPQAACDRIRSGAEPVEQPQPGPHQSSRALRRASLQRSYAGSDEHPLLELS